jgi:translation initiation factor IF-3
MSLGDAISLARGQGVDLVEIAPQAKPPVCRVVDYGKFRYEKAKQDKASKKHQHANKVKEVQLRPSIDPHDFGTKVARAIDFICEDMKVKATLRFRGREMAHKEYGFKVVEEFIKELAPYGQPDAAPRLMGRSLNVMLSPLPRNKRAANPHQGKQLSEEPSAGDGEASHSSDSTHESGDEDSSDTFTNDPFSDLDGTADQKG